MSGGLADFRTATESVMEALRPLRMISFQSGREENVLVIKRQPSHLVILCHGLQGNAGHMEYLMKSIEKTNPDYLCMNVSCNDDNGWFKNYSKTSESLKIVGPRIREELFQFLENQFADNFSWSTDHLTQITLIGSSLGGIYMRYLAGLLFDSKENLISFDICSRTDQTKLSFRLKPMCYISLASPHLGVSGLVSNLFGTGIKLLFYNGIGNELVLDDEEIIFYHLATSEPYINALKAFQHRISYASCSFDEWRVPYPSSAISPFHYQPNQSTKLTNNNNNNYDNDNDNAKYVYLKGVHSIQENELNIIDNQHEKEVKYYDQLSDQKKQLLDSMITSLRSMNWTVVDVDLLHAQVAVLNSNRQEIVEHVLSVLV